MRKSLVVTLLLVCSALNSAADHDTLALGSAIDAVPTHYFVKSSLFSRSETLGFLTSSQIQQGDRVLIIGCGSREAGPGYWVALAARLVGPSGTVHVYDSNASQLGTAMSNLQRYSAATGAPVDVVQFFNRDVLVTPSPADTNLVSSLLYDRVIVSHIFSKGQTGLLWKLLRISGTVIGPYRYGKRVFLTSTSNSANEDWKRVFLWPSQLHSDELVSHQDGPGGRRLILSKSSVQPMTFDSHWFAGWVGRKQCPPSSDQQSALPLSHSAASKGAMVTQNWRSTFRRSYVGHDPAFQDLAHLIDSRAEGYRMRRSQPIVCLIFGPSGTGKTQFAKSLSKSLGEPLISITLNQFTEANAVARLMGTSAGYKGYGDEVPLQQLLRNPKAIVLLDELEKAHPDVLNFFLNVFDEGQFRLANGTQIFCSQATFILTSNIAQHDVVSDVVFHSVSDGDDDSASDYEPVVQPHGPAYGIKLPKFVTNLATRVIDKVSTSLGRGSRDAGSQAKLKKRISDHIPNPAFLARIESFYAFGHYSKDDLAGVCPVILQRIADQLCETGRHFWWHPKVVNSIVQSFSVSNGVRALEKILDRHVMDIIRQHKHVLLPGDSLFLNLDPEVAAKAPSPGKRHPVRLVMQLTRFPDGVVSQDGGPLSTDVTSKSSHTTLVSDSSLFSDSHGLDVHPSNSPYSADMLEAEHEHELELETEPIAESVLESIIAAFHQVAHAFRALPLTEVATVMAALVAFFVSIYFGVSMVTTVISAAATTMAIAQIAVAGTVAAVSVAVVWPYLYLLWPVLLVGAQIAKRGIVWVWNNREFCGTLFLLFLVLWIVRKVLMCCGRSLKRLGVGHAPPPPSQPLPEGAQSRPKSPRYVNNRS